MNPEVIYENTVDSESWKLVVTSDPDDEHRGTMTVTSMLDHYGVSKDQVIYQSPVTISYAAIFGPDMDDVLQWCATSLREIDKVIADYGN